MKIPLVDFFECHYPDVDVRINVNITEEPKNGFFTIVIEEVTEDHDYSEDTSEETKAFYAVVAKVYGLSPEGSLQYIKDSWATLKSHSGQVWQFRDLYPTSMSFGDLGGPFKVETRFKYTILGG